MPGDRGPWRYDWSRELEFEDRLPSALPQSPTIPSCRFADSNKFDWAAIAASDKFKSGLDRAVWDYVGL